MKEGALESHRSDQFFDSRYFLLQILYLKSFFAFQSCKFWCQYVQSDCSQSGSLAWEGEAAEERVQRRVRHLHLANDQDPKNKSIAQQAMALTGPLADIEDAIFYMDGFSFGDSDGDLFDCHTQLLKKMRSAWTKMSSCMEILSFLLLGENGHIREQGATFSLRRR